ncbi:MAG: hypothetical protein GC184_06960 [Rhizobiales bacterium]|nr:hypothetical protein [Hyphomicrobiales bacterium]
MSEWFAKLSTEEKTKMFRRGLIIGLLACAGLGFLIWKMNEGVGIAAQNDQVAETNESARAKTTVNSSATLIDGFRSAKFGDDEDAVRAAIKKDFGISGDDIKVLTNASLRTRLLMIRVKDLLPDSGNSQIIYTLGYKSKALFHVYVLWGTPVSPDATAVSIAKTAISLKSYFNSLGFDPKKTIRDRKLKNGAILSFHGSDAAGHSVDLIYNENKGKPAGKDANGKETPAIKPTYTLRLAYSKDPKNPDVFEIDKGQF